MDKLVNIFILNWNGKIMTLDCLRSLNKVTYPNINIVLIDNGSTDGSVNLIKKEFPNIEIIQSMRNLGYAGGNNYGYFFTSGPNSWHGMEKKEIKKERRCIQINYVTFETDWKVR